MAYIVKRPITLNGKRRLIGEIVQDDEITQSAIIRMKWVEKVKETNKPDETLAMNAPIGGQESAPAPRPRKKSRKKAATEDGGEA